MDHRRQGQPDPASPSGASLAGRGKKNAPRLLTALEELIQQARPAVTQQRCFDRLREQLLAQLACLGRHTLSGVTVTAGGADSDWSAPYRLYSQARFDPDLLFHPVRRSIEQSLPAEDPLIVALDDSLLRKTGTHIPGVAYRKDPLGPAFQVNLVRGQRFLQLSAALPLTQLPWARLIPIDFQLLHNVRKPRKFDPDSAWVQYRQACRLHRVTALAARRIQSLRETWDAKRRLWIIADGRFTNRVVLKDLPKNSVFTGRIRADAKLYFLPQNSCLQRGRRRIYGEPAPTPEQIRRDDSIPWIRVSAFAAGKNHDFRLKVVRPLRWRATSDQYDVQLIVIAPLAYRPRKQSRVLYRQPAYLICTDPSIPLQQVLQAYLWRWDIEVNFRDEKTLLGLGQAQVRHPNSVKTAPALSVAAYAMLLTAAHNAFASASPQACLPPPKWNRKTKARSSTQDLIRALRYDLWAQAISPNLSHFTHQPLADQTSPKSLPNLQQALFRAHL